MVRVGIDLLHLSVFLERKELDPVQVPKFYLVIKAYSSLELVWYITFCAEGRGYELGL